MRTIKKSTQPAVGYTDIYVCYLLLIFISSTMALSDKMNACNPTIAERHNATSNCLIQNSTHQLYCWGNNRYDNYDFNELGVNANDVWLLTICNTSQLLFNANRILSKFYNVTELIIVDGNLTKITTAFPAEATKLERIHISGTKLRYLPDDCFKNLPALRSVDLRNNSLTVINPKVLSSSPLTQALDYSVYLAGNPWKCDENMFWIINDENYSSLIKRIVDRDKLHCTEPYASRSLIAVISIMTTLKQECQQTPCECELVYVIGGHFNLREQNFHRRSQLMAFITVNCSFLGLTEMPKFIPENTTKLYLTGNKISDLSPLVENPVYRQVLDLYLDDNLIGSIAQLDGSYWLEHFRLFSLRGNKLTDLPTYALENALHNSVTAVSIFLGHNPWTCDCFFTPGFQDLLIKYTNIFKDINDIRCNSTSSLYSSEHNKILNKPIKDLTRTEICIIYDEESWLSFYPLDILNIILALIIVLIIGKLAYDYWAFKKTGKLPWIVTKIP
ncbi:protein singed wings 2 [Microplitis demolitor]|uniref:protein singed wings 2 n=1 Tax=Microplitis demolitor TaxID=69319 RepID=UPI0004CCE26B|nr:protein singed wings 2 [Microplitis demolitor]